MREGHYVLTVSCDDPRHPDWGQAMEEFTGESQTVASRRAREAGWRFKSSERGSGRPAVILCRVCRTKRNRR